MKVYLLDTNIASALWDVADTNHGKALQFIRDAAAAGSVVYISRVVIAEIEYGQKLYASTDPARRAKADAAMRAYKMIKEINKGTTEHYSSIRAALFMKFGPLDTKGRIKSVRPEQLVDKTTALRLGIQENDLWMAAIAVQYNMTFVSEDKINNIKTVWPSLDVVKWK